MSDIINQLISVFEELRSASITGSDNPVAVMKKYDILMVGDKMNVVYTQDLYHALSGYFHISIENSDFQKLVPAVCHALSMKCEPMQAINDLGNPEPAAYRVELW